MSDPTAPPRVVIADDQALVRSGFRMILGSVGIPVVGEASDGGQALAAVLEHRPDVALMDIRMPGMDGLEATRRILAGPAGAGCRIIILTTFDLDQYVYAALTAGASGFLLKDVSPEQLVDAVRSGDALLAPSITRRLVERFASAASAPPAVHGDLSELTPRELEVLQLLARGLSNAELAAELVLSEATVKTHVGPDSAQARAARPGAGRRLRLPDRPGRRSLGHRTLTGRRGLGPDRRSSTLESD